MKDLLEQVSIALGFDGEINEQVNQWVEHVENRYEYEGDDLIKFIRSALVYWKNTGYMVCNKVVGG